MSNTKDEIRKAEEKIETILDELHRHHGVRTFRLQIISERSEDLQVSITPFYKGGRLS